MRIPQQQSGLSDPFSFGAQFWFGVKVGLAIGWGLPIMAVAAVLAVSLIGIPLAIVLMPIAAYPWTRLIQNRSKRIAAWQMRDRSLNEGEEVPWEV